MGIGLILSIFLMIIIVLIIISYSRRINKIQEESKRQAQEMFSQWTQQHSNELRTQIEQSVEMKYKAMLEQWTIQKESEIRKDAVTKSINTLLGKISEEFAPIFIAQKYSISPKDFRHLGSPVDFVAFKGLSDESEPEIIFFEIKTGKSSALTERERKIRDAIVAKRVKYEVINLNSLVEDAKRKISEEIDKVTKE
ncbi:Holliday junction resolvase-like protein [Sulfolobus acidocaldarius]|uniref:Conserved Archaeal protein n=4 Tax=Sulfolobus acidocaldarius TaxID=2285 RepID=Q4J7V0_SULAC|nr:Holliday junction resolvase-like protein [Sulfolobus acidocaldarius]AAY81130.1 conserved Archaeal protein [Sulfolobus acidocaldarius DSM 639]AGE71740.1 hypothetical protein SacN8_08900 [Sulfolobus acidocaldarius N8]AGE74013.1 hypothetical protein SacRon12I_08910 [Sulfolobus acidocaldarius Ron12/I]ALU30057.1 endonuclease [Sulfolobus acidocaldarius]ALU30747.1 endonuclease [Sulfolobus acidocaldarius]